MKFYDTNPTTLEVEVIDYACILKKENLEENDRGEEQSQGQVL